MSENICKNCKWFESIGKDLVSALAGPYDFNVGFCAAQPFDSRKIGKDQMAVVCGHDGGIWVGEEFGCIHWELKNERKRYRD